jgi:hypothetical protein
MATKKPAASKEKTAKKPEKKKPAIDFGSNEEKAETNADETSDEEEAETDSEDSTEQETEQVAEEVEETVEVAEEIVVMSPKRQLHHLSDGLIKQLTTMGIIPASAEEFLITITAEDDSEVEATIKVSRDPKGFVESIYDVITSGVLKKEDAKAFFAKVAKFASKIDFQIEVAESVGKSLAFFMSSDDEKKFNRLLTRLDKFEATADPKFKMLALSFFNEAMNKLSAEEKERKTVAALVDDDM